MRDRAATRPVLLLTALCLGAVGCTRFAHSSPGNGAAVRAAERIALVYEFERLPEERLAVLARDVDEDAAVTAVIALGRRGGPRTDKAVRALRRAMDDPRVRVRRIAVLSLFNLVHNRPGGFESDDVVQAVLAGIRDPDKGVAQTALVAVEYLKNDPAVLPELLDVMQSSRTSVHMRSHLAWAAIFFKTPHSAPALLKCLDVDDHFFIYLHAASTLKAISGIDLDRPKQPGKWEEYRDLYGSAEWRLRTKAFYAAWWEKERANLLADPLAGRSVSDDVRTLFKELSGDDWSARQSATRRLAARGASVRPLLERGARALDVRVAMQSRKALAIMDGGTPALGAHRIAIARPLPPVADAIHDPVTSDPPVFPAYPTNPFSFRVDHGGHVTAADLTGDGLPDFLIIGAVGRGADRRPRITAYDHRGRRLWAVSPEVPQRAVPHNPVADFLDNGAKAFAYLRADNVIEMRSCADGRVVRTAGPFKALDGSTFGDGSRRPRMRVVNLAGTGRRDLVLGVRRLLLALGPDLKPYWNLEVEGAWGHYELKAADLTGDGRHEILLGGTGVAPTGEVLFTMQAGAHMDDCAAADFLPDRPGLEVMYAQERGADGVLLCDARGLVWELVTGEEPQNLIAGNLVDRAPGAEAYCPARGGRRPFIVAGTGWIPVGFGDATADGRPPPFPLGWDWHLEGALAEARADRWLVTQAADVDGDGLDELLIRRRGRLRLLNTDTWTLTPEPDGWRTGVAVLLNVAGDGRPELVRLRDSELTVWSVPRQTAP